MTSPRFRSTEAFDTRRRHRAPAVDRATFVLFSWDGQDFAAPAESVERVLRGTGDGASVHYAERTIPVVDGRSQIAVGPAAATTPGARTLVLRVPQGWLAIVVDAVHEVVTIDVPSIRAIPAETNGWWFDARGVTVWPAAARGIFTRHERDVVILDILRLTCQ